MTSKKEVLAWGGIKWKKKKSCSILHFNFNDKNEYIFWKDNKKAVYQS